MCSAYFVWECKRDVVLFIIFQSSIALSQRVVAAVTSCRSNSSFNEWLRAVDGSPDNRKLPSLSQNANCHEYVTRIFCMLNLVQSSRQLCRGLEDYASRFYLKLYYNLRGNRNVTAANILRFANVHAYK